MRFDRKFARNNTRFNGQAAKCSASAARGFAVLGRRALLLFFALLCGVASTRAARAQLATSFYNVTAIETKTLPNAVRITIRTDGTLRFGADLNQFINFDAGFQAKPISSLRLRLLGARSRLPAFINVGAYPVDSAAVTLGRDDIGNPYFNDYNGYNADPRLDIELRFYVPLLVQRFDFSNGNNITFSQVLNALGMSIELGEDRSSIIITVVPDRTDAGARERLQRSPRETQKHQLSVTPLSGALLNEQAAASTRFRIEALHTPLVEVLDRAARAMGFRFVTAKNIEDIDVSLVLPAATPEEFLRALSEGYDLVLEPDAAPDADLSSSADLSSEAASPLLRVRREEATTERITLNHLSPERARLLLPDFLLPSLRVDVQNSALLVSGSPRVVTKLRRDLAFLDQPRAQVRVEASAWEFASNAEARLALQAARVGARNAQSVDTQAGTFAFSIARNEQTSLRASLDALVARGRAKLRAKPFLVVASGETANLFSGQTRYVQVLQNNSGNIEARAIPLQIGYQLAVTPRVGADSIEVFVNPRFSTVDEIEAGTGLPTIGIREANATLRLQPGDAIIVGGLTSDLDFKARRRSLLSRVPLLGRLFNSRRENQTRTALLLMVTVRKV